MKKKRDEKEKLYLPPINLNTDEDKERFLKKIEGTLPSEEGTANYSLAVSSIINKRAASKPRGEREQKATIRAVVEYMVERGKEPNFESLLSVLEYDGALDKIFYDRTVPNPPPLQVLLVNREQKVVETQRYEDPSNKINIRFDTIQRYLRDIRKEKLSR